MVKKIYVCVSALFLIAFASFLIERSILKEIWIDLSTGDCFKVVRVMGVVIKKNKIDGPVSDEIRRLNFLSDRGKLISFPVAQGGVFQKCIYSNRDNIYYDLTSLVKNKDVYGPEEYRAALDATLQNLITGSQQKDQ